MSSESAWTLPKLAGGVHIRGILAQKMTARLGLPTAPRDSRRAAEDRFIKNLGNS